jgi:uncharacterized protein YndB with AHSA1/START domain
MVISPAEHRRAALSLQTADLAMLRVVAMAETLTRTEGRELVVEREFDAPRELVWQAFTEPERVARWFGPRGWTLPVCTMDVREGGEWHYCMRGPNGEESWGKAVYREIVPPERIVYTDQFADAQGKANPRLPEMLITLRFEDVGGKTKLTSRTEFPTDADLQKILAMGVVKGLTETWDKLADYLAAD